MKILATNKENRLLDNKAINKYKIDSSLLMESAGLQAFLYIKKNYDISKVLILCGKGNNGGDALVIARYMLLENKKVDILIFDDIKSDLTKKHLNSCKLLKANIINEISTYDYSLVIDGILGSGIKPNINDSYLNLFKFINTNFSQDKIVSLDQNSGYSDLISPSSYSIKSDLIINFGLDKIANYHPSFQSKFNKIYDINPGFKLNNIKTNSYLYDFSDLKIKRLKKNDYKNSRKHVLCFVGSKKYSGALRLVLKSLYKSRIGMVSCYTDKEILKEIGENHPSIILDSLENFDFKSKNKYDALLIGCGSDNLINKELLEKLLNLDIPTVIDASALKIFSLLNDINRKSKLIITPHLGEIRNFNVENIENLSSIELKDKLFSISKKYNCDIVLKSNVNWIVENDNLNIIPSNNPKVGVSGSGDILASIITSFLAQNIKDPITMANLAHQKAASLLDYYFESDDILSKLDIVIKESEV